MKGEREEIFHLERGTKQGEPLSTLLFNSLPQYLMKPIAETVEEC